MYILEGLEPTKVFKYFEEISRIPRGSGNEKQVSDYLVNFAKERNLFVEQDSLHNVIIKKDATPGYENSTGVIIQGHMDMVNEKNADTIHDFDKDPIKLFVDGDYIKAEGTTLGADNGIAVAMGLAILDSNYEHPKLEVIITSDEEAGMSGAIGIDVSNIEGRLFINADSGSEGKFLASCAGGITQILKINTKYTEVPSGFLPYSIKVKGLCGGHSGLDIIKELGNSNVLMARILSEIFNNNDIYISSINGGLKNNAIPRESEAGIYLNEKDLDSVINIVKDMENIFKNELKSKEPNLSVIIEKNSKQEKCFTKELSRNLVSTLLLIPNGVESMSASISGLVQTSNNIGVINTYDDNIEIVCATRSSVDSLKYFLVDKVKHVASLINASHEASGVYPGLEYKEDSFLREKCLEVYKKLTSKEGEVIAIHAGLECGVFAEKIGDNIDMVSLGPDMWGIHTPEEKLSISSTNRVFNFLIELLKELK